MNFTSKDYLPNSEERIEHLQKIIDGRPVAILAAGPSIKELEKRISELRHADICYFGLNDFSVQEAHILQQINNHLSVVMCSDHINLSKYLKAIINLLDRDEDNMFVSEIWRDILKPTELDFYHFSNKYDRKLIFFSLNLERTVPNSNFPLHFIVSNSLLVLIQLAIIGKASKIVLFGADGYCENDGEAYYNNICESDDVRRKSVIDDTNRYFNPIAPIAIRNIYKTYNLAPIDILNCSESSFYTPFPIISYDDAFEYLLTGKKYNKKSDLRAPKVSVISPYSNTGKHLRGTVESISNQSYSNHEHIVVYGKADDETRDMMRQFPDVRWISEKNVGSLQAFKKGISMARGEYIFHCHIADGYLNQDWFNTCVEVLENNPDISLVWGLSQNMFKDGALGRIPDAYFFDNPPPQGKSYVYYWLKKKILFSEGNFCVRKKVLEECFPFHDSKASDELGAWFVFNYKFNTFGYLPYFVPIVANYCRMQVDVEGQRRNKGLNTQIRINTYREDIEQYKKKLIRGKIAHQYRNGAGELFSDGFSLGSFLFFDMGRYINAKLRCIKANLPKGLRLIVEKVLFFWRAYRWNACKVVIVRIWFRLTKVMTQSNYQ
ncbi:MAG: glycosyltransferase [Proteobacteria bacterium]|nr:glycosyltransferase [Pseudomonadota bacterium]